MKSLTRFVVLAVCGAVVILAAVRMFVHFTHTGMMMEFMPHGQCVEWRMDLLGLFIASNAVIALAYFAIPSMLVVLLHKSPQLLFDTKIVAGFAVFILFCGITHVFKLITVWWPIYWTSTAMDCLTAVVSIWVAAQLGEFANGLRRIANLQREYDVLRARLEELGGA